MKDHLYITNADFNRLQLLIEGQHVTVFEKEYLRMLQRELGRAQVVEPEAIPPDVVAVNSEVLIRDLDSGDTRIYKLVLPAQARAENSISILTPLGAAMLGYRVGDIIELPVPGGIWRLKVLDVLFQPEPVSVCCQ